jgi:hypothetical protein
MPKAEEPTTSYTGATAVIRMKPPLELEMVKMRESVGETKLFLTTWVSGSLNEGEALAYVRVKTAPLNVLSTCRLIAVILSGCYGFV